MARALLLVALGAMLTGACVWAVWVWGRLGDTDISGHGIAALTLGVVLSLAVGVGLMGLVFVSARHGYDERAYHDFGEGDDHGQAGGAG